MKSKIWIDIENTPHVWFFKPIIEGLQRKGHEIIVTARDYGGIRSLLEIHKIKHMLIGGDHGKNKYVKAANVLLRIMRLAFYIRNKGIVISISHGSRSHIGAAFLLRIPIISGFDYEHSSKFIFGRLVHKRIVPKYLGDDYLASQGFVPENTIKYDGFKEQLYIYDFRPDESYLANFEIKPEAIVILVRPPAFSSHYFTELSGNLFSGLLDYLGTKENIYVIFSPRDEKQKVFLKDLSGSFKFRFHIIEKDVDGLNLIWNSDVIFSGGGTMNREAAIMGVPVYSIFGGKTGAVNLELNRLGRLDLIRDAGDFNKAKIVKRDKSANFMQANIKDHIVEEILKFYDTKIGR